MRFLLLENYYNSPGYHDDLKNRALELIKLDGDPIYRLKQFEKVYGNDVIKFVEQFGIIKIPEYNSAAKPFFLFSYQKNILLKLVDSEDDINEHEILIDKVREMGLTWVLVWYIIWRWLFKKGWSAFVMSRTEDEVDDGSDNPDNSIFGKIRWSIKKLPLWIKPEGFTHKFKKGTSTDMTLRILNPALGTSINGSTTNAQAGRSRRYNFVFVDEAFYVDNFGSVYSALQTVARTKVFVSTSRAGFVYKSLRDLCEEKDDYISLSWKDNPFKDQIWYDEQMKKASVDDNVMKEIEVSYAVSGKSQYYPESAKAQVRPVEYDRQLPIYVFLDIGKNDLTVLGYAQYDSQMDLINIIECYFNQQRPMEWYIPFLNWGLFFAQPGGIPPTKILNEAQYNPKQLELLKKLSQWKKPRAYFGEPAHRQKVMPLNISNADVLFKEGQIHLTTNDKAMTYEPRRKATSMLLPKMVFNSQSEYVMRLHDAIVNSRYANASRSTSETAGLKPVHDSEIADFRSALENFCVNFPKAIRTSQHDPATRQSGEHISQYSKLAKYLRS